MGMIKIEFSGSFGNSSMETGAEAGGHAQAVGRAMDWLCDQLSGAIQKDHDLHEAGTHPPKAPFGKDA